MKRHFFLLFLLAIPTVKAASDEAKIDTGRLKNVSQAGIVSFKGLSSAPIRGGIAST